MSHSSLSSIKPKCDLSSLKEQVNSHTTELHVFGDFRVHSCQNHLNLLFDDLYAKVSHFFLDSTTEHQVRNLYYNVNKLSCAYELLDDFHLHKNMDDPIVIAGINKYHKGRLNKACQDLKLVLKPNVNVTMLLQKSRIDGYYIFYHIKLVEKLHKIDSPKKKQENEISTGQNTIVQRADSSSFHSSLKTSLDRTLYDMSLSLQSEASFERTSAATTPLVVSVDGIHTLSNVASEAMVTKNKLSCPNLLNVAITGSMFCYSFLESLHKLRQAILNEDLEHAYIHVINLVVLLESGRSENGQEVTPFFGSLYQEARALESYLTNELNLELVGGMDVEETKFPCKCRIIKIPKKVEPSLYSNFIGPEQEHRSELDQENEESNTKVRTQSL